MPVNENDASIFLISLANNAAESSKRDNDTALRGTTRDFEHNNLVWLYIPRTYMYRRRLHRPFGLHRKSHEFALTAN